MKALHLMVLSAAIVALPIVGATQASAQQRPASGGPRITLPSHSNHFSWERKHRFRGGFGVLRQAQDERVLIVEREMPVIVEREVVREVPAGNSGTPNTDVPNSPRKPYVVGNSYASLPGGCMKMIEGGASYYYCGGGEWYRQLGGGRDARYRAVARRRSL